MVLLFFVIVFRVISIAFPPHFPGCYLPPMPRGVGHAKTALDHKELRKMDQVF